MADNAPKDNQGNNGNSGNNQGNGNNQNTLDDTPDDTIKIISSSGLILIKRPNAIALETYKKKCNDVMVIELSSGKSYKIYTNNNGPISGVDLPFVDKDQFQQVIAAFDNM